MKHIKLALLHYSRSGFTNFQDRRGQQIDFVEKHPNVTTSKKEIYAIKLRLLALDCFILSMKAFGQ